MQRGNGTTDYARLTKQGFLLGVSAFLVGELTEPVQHTLEMSVPGWEHSLLFLLTVLGVLTALLAPLVFGIALPLTQ
jgi:hypothetical protein